MPLIFLVGPRASGKTTVGRALARRLDLPFVDTDEYVQRTSGRSVAQIVDAEGWPDFRRRESAALRQAAALHAGNGIVATGGGMVLAPENRLFMRAQGIVFYLVAPAATLAARLCRSPLAAQRPPLTGADAGGEVAAVLAQRQPLYEEAAHCQLDATQTPEQICAAALSALRASPPSGQRP